MLWSRTSANSRNPVSVPSERNITFYWFMTKYAYLEERSKQMVKTCLLINMGATWPGILDVFIRHTQGKLFKSLTYNSSFWTPLIFLLCVCQSAKKIILALFLAYMLFGSKTIYGRGVQKPGCFSNAKKKYSLPHKIQGKKLLK